MATRRGPPERLTDSRDSGPEARLDRFTQSARAARKADDAALADLVDRALGLGCVPGDMRLAYGWRAAVVTAAFVALVVGVVSRALLTGLFVEFVTDDVVPVTEFNVAVTVLATLVFGVARARRFRLAVHHRLVPIRRGVRRRFVRWRRSARQRNRHRRDRVAYRCRRVLRDGSRRMRTRLRRGRHRRAVALSGLRRTVARWRRSVRTRRRRERRRGGRTAARVRRRLGRATRRLRGWWRRRRYGSGRRRVGALATRWLAGVSRSLRRLSTAARSFARRSRTPRAPLGRAALALLFGR